MMTEEVREKKSNLEDMIHELLIKQKKVSTRLEKWVIGEKILDIQVIYHKLLGYYYLRPYYLGLV